MDLVVMGPALVTGDEVAFPPELEVESRVNGEVRQHANTRAFIQAGGSDQRTVARDDAEAGTSSPPGPRGRGDGF